MDPTFTNGKLQFSPVEYPAVGGRGAGSTFQFCCLELTFTDAYAVDLSSKIYNEFITDNTNLVGAQKDIYFIGKHLLTDDNLPLIKRLMEINLLASVVFNDKHKGQYESYFVPLLKPGVSREYFISQADPNGTKTHGLWRTILRDRDMRISSWFKNRS